MNARQAAEYRDSIARARLAYLRYLQTGRLEPSPKRPRPRTRKPRLTLVPRSDPIRDPTTAEQQLADKLLQHVCVDSVVDRAGHALGVARMVLRSRPKRASGHG